MNEFRFERPEMLWLLLLVPPALIAFLIWAWRKRQRLLGEFIEPRLLVSLTAGVSLRAGSSATPCLSPP